MTKEQLKSRISALTIGDSRSLEKRGGELSSILNGIIDLIPTLPEPYVLPTASAETLGGVKVGDGLQISEQGVLSSSGGGALIVEGRIEDISFISNEGQPTCPEARAAIAQGRDVIIHDSGAAYYHWVFCSPDDNNILFSNSLSEEDYIVWVGE